MGDETFEQLCERYEMDQAALETEVLGSARAVRLLKRKCLSADWPAVVATYQDATLRRVKESGSNLYFSQDLYETIMGAVSEEFARRAGSDIPAGHGMGEDGAQS